MLAAIYKATQNYVPYPQFGAINYLFQLRAQYPSFRHAAGGKRFATGITLNAFYTYQKNLANTDGEGTAYRDYLLQPKSGEGPNRVSTRRTAFVSVLTYQLPFGKGRRWMNKGGLFNQVLGGWEFTETQTLQSGTPFTVTFSGSPYQYLPGASRPNIVTTFAQATVAGWSIGPNRFPTSAQNPYLNISSFAYPAPFTPGRSGAQYVLRAPGSTGCKCRMVKWWTVKERYRFEIRLDGYNWPLEQPNYSPTRVPLSIPAAQAPSRA